VRYIEYMDVGSSNGWRMDEVVSGAEIISMIDKELPLEPIGALYHGEVARRYRHASGEIGVITSVTRPFCQNCTRARVSAEGTLYTCLFASSGHDVRALLRSEMSDEAISKALSAVWQARSDRYSEIRTGDSPVMPKVEMSRMGG
jgi:cyclic pyranopterin phosphate synthase